MPTKPHTRMKDWDEIADMLRSLASESSGLTKKMNKSFIVLERKLRKSDSNKNAVSLKREGVSFMLSDLTEAAAEAKLLGFPAEPDRDFPQRLLFQNLELSRVAAHSDLFRRLTKEAALHSEHLQSFGLHEES